MSHPLDDLTLDDLIDLPPNPDFEPPPLVKPESLLIDIGVLSALLDRSVASLERDASARRLPAPIRLGGSRKWRRKEIEAWVDAGCPLQAVWETRTGPPTEPKP